MRRSLALLNDLQHSLIIAALLLWGSVSDEAEGRVHQDGRRLAPLDNLLKLALQAQRLLLAGLKKWGQAWRLPIESRWHRLPRRK